MVAARSNLFDSSINVPVGYDSFIARSIYLASSSEDHLAIAKSLGLQLEFEKETRTRLKLSAWRLIDPDKTRSIRGPASARGFWIIGTRGAFALPLHSAGTLRAHRDVT